MTCNYNSHIITDRLISNTNLSRELAKYLKVKFSFSWSTGGGESDGTFLFLIIVGILVVTGG
jgi:hypothetical protein